MRVVFLVVNWRHFDRPGQALFQGDNPDLFAVMDLILSYCFIISYQDFPGLQSASYGPLNMAGLPGAKQSALCFMTP
jgi:hypothetical protein